MNRNSQGFTVLEILTVIVIMTCVAATFAIAVGPRMYAAKSAPTCEQNMRQIVTALHLYVEENDGSFPVSYLRSQSVLGSRDLQWRCPLSSHRSYEVSLGFTQSQIQNPDRVLDPDGNPLPSFDPTRDVLVRCLHHGFEGFDIHDSPGWNVSSKDSRGRVLGVRFDGSVQKVAPVSCWELRTMSASEMQSIAWKSCDDPNKH